MSYKKKPKPKEFRVDMDTAEGKVFVRDRADEVAVACFRHSGIGNHKTIVVLQAVAHSLVLEDHSRGISYDPNR